MDISTQVILSGIVLAAVGFALLCVLNAGSKPRDLPPKPPGEKKIKSAPLSLDGARKKRKKKAA